MHNPKIPHMRPLAPIQRTSYALGWKKQQHMPNLEAMTRTVVTFGIRWGMSWAISYLTSGLVWEEHLRAKKRNRWKKFR